MALTKCDVCDTEYDFGDLHHYETEMLCDECFQTRIEQDQIRSDVFVKEDFDDRAF